MTKRQAIELRKKWKQRADRTSCQHPKLEIERGNDAIVTATYYCLTCGKDMLRIYR